MSVSWNRLFVLVVLVPWAVPASVDGRPTFRKPPPEGVIEVVGKLGRGWSLVELKDGALMGVAGSSYRTSDDDGVSWGKAKKLPDGIGVDGGSIMRLNSGALAIYNRKHIWRSTDEGQTWDEGSPIPMVGWPYFGTLFQMTNGRLIYPNRAVFAGEHPETPGGHTHKPEIDIGSISYSDDEGKTWKLCKGHLMGWFDHDGDVNGRGGVTPFDEPSAAQTKDGRVLCFARSTVGRIVATYSKDAGETWSVVRPTLLAASYSPCRLVRIPQTGDLMCVWNQVSRAEIRAGYRRSRLSVAISDDSGRSWKNFKTIEIGAGLQDVEQLVPEFPIMHVGSKWSDRDRLPEFGIFRYMNVCFAKGKVYIMYVREWLDGDFDPRVFEDAKGEFSKRAEQVLRIYPLEYFYHE